MFSVTYISDVYRQKQIFNALTIYRRCNVPFSSKDSLIRNLYRFKKYSFWKILATFLKIKCNDKKKRECN